MTAATPNVGRDGLPFTSQPPAVEPGQAGALRDGVYAVDDMPVGLKVAHCLDKLVKSGAIAVGVPDRSPFA